MSKDIAEDARLFEDLHRRFMFVWQARTPGHLGDISMTEFRAMATMEARGEATMGEVSKALGLTLGASTSVMDRLVSAGYAARRHDEKDRRVVRAGLTPKGRDVLQKVIGAMVGHMERILAKTGPEERSAFLETYRRIVAIAEEDLS